MPFKDPERNRLRMRLYRAKHEHSLSRRQHLSLGPAVQARIEYEAARRYAQAQMAPHFEEELGELDAYLLGEVSG